MITIGDVVQYLDSFAPPSYQEDYDNSGLITGDVKAPVKSILVTLDCTEDVLEEALSLGANLVIAHHPIVFRGLKKITGRNYVERTVIKAIKNDIAIFAIHTNLDNVHTGVNRKIAERIGLINVRVLAPKRQVLSKLVTFIPTEQADEVIDALHAAGGGNVGKYDHCSFRVEGTGSFRPGPGANPTVGVSGNQEFVSETRVEMLFPSHLEMAILKALKVAHPYEEVAYFVERLENENQEVGSGMIGELSDTEEPIEFLERLKSSMNTKCVRHTPVLTRKVKRVAVCGGSGSFLLPVALREGADVLVTADFKYHEFFDADGKIIIADIGHYESEQFTKELISEVLREKFRTFAINFSKTVTNPIRYL